MGQEDTSADAAERLRAVHRGLGPAGRVALAAEMSEQAFPIGEDGIRWRHLDYGDGEVRWTALRVRLGDDLFALAYPDVPLLAS